MGREGSSKHKTGELGCNSPGQDTEGKALMQLVMGWRETEVLLHMATEQGTAHCAVWLDSWLWQGEKLYA